MKRTATSPLIRLGRLLPNRLRVPLKSLYRSQIRPARVLSSPLRMAPSFFIIGTMKGGTTSLAAHLDQGSDVAMAFKKEVEYFDLNPDRGRLWYRSHFPLRHMPFIDARPLQCGEASSGYLFHPWVPQRLAAECPTAKLIVLLRNPIDRAISHHHAMVASNREDLGLTDAIYRELDAPEIPHELVRKGGPGLEFSSFRLHSYFSRGLYAEQLERWLRWFPRSSLLVIRSEDLFAGPAAIVAEVRGFLGLAPVENHGPYRVHNPRRETASELVTSDDRLAAIKLLRSLYSEPNRRLYEDYGIRWQE